MKNILVVAAIIVEGNKIFTTQRGYGEFKGWWEFPGGKIEKGETPEEALKREIKEELDTKIEVIKYVANIEYDYPTFHLSMKCFECRVLEGHLALLEAENAKWVNKEEIDSIDWLPADKTIIEQVKALID